jgi:hypothetical protein
MGDFGGSSKMRVEQGVRDALHESGPSAGLSPHGAAMESNHPSGGLLRPAGFEDRMCD